ncbi:AraC family transcriptional regulator [Funiculus sociatus GB2-C1]
MQRIVEPPPADTAKPTAPQSIFPACPKLREVFDFIEANYHQAITLKDVAKAVRYSPAYLTDLVGRQTGKTVNLWIVERRMAEACSLLLETNHSVDRIAEVVGYQNAGHFFRQFRQYHGTTPQGWRNAQRN